MDVVIDPATGKEPIPPGWLYDVDLPAGVYSAREILDFCCVANLNKAFLVRPIRGKPSPIVIFLTGLLYGNPLAPPRVEAIRFWELQIGKPTNGTPSRDEVRAAMSDPNPEKRLAAGLYLEAADENYTPADLIGNADGSEQAIWTVLGEGYAQLRGADTDLISFVARNDTKLNGDLKQINNPSLALLTALQLTREKQDTGYLDEMIKEHTFTEAEIVAIKPELYRMARSSKAVRDKLLAMKSQVPELSPVALGELANTNFFGARSTRGKRELSIIFS